MPRSSSSGTWWPSLLFGSGWRPSVYSLSRGVWRAQRPRFRVSRGLLPLYLCSFWVSSSFKSDRGGLSFIWQGLGSAQEPDSAEKHFYIGHPTMADSFKIASPSSLIFPLSHFPFYVLYCNEAHDLLSLFVQYPSSPSSSSSTYTPISAGKEFQFRSRSLVEFFGFHYFLV